MISFKRTILVIIGVVILTPVAIVLVFDPSHGLALGQEVIHAVWSVVSADILVLAVVASAILWAATIGSLFQSKKRG